MSHRDRWILLATLSAIAVMIAADLITDAREGVPLWHLSVEGTAGLLALAGVFYILNDMVRLRHDLKKERHLSIKLKQEAETWRQRSRDYLNGLSTLIDAQLAQWGLTPAEREVAFLLLKGLSLKDIALARGTSEKTARTQSLFIYAKAGLNSRAELSAFFLEDLLPAQPDKNTD